MRQLDLGMLRVTHGMGEESCCEWWCVREGMSYFSWFLFLPALFDVIEVALQTDHKHII